MSAFTSRSIKIAFYALLLPAAAAAQQRDTTLTDSTRWVTLRPVVVTISKLPMRAARANFSLSVVERRELSSTQPVYAADALRSVAGAYIDEAAGAGGPAIVRLRAGEEVFTQILMDGVTVNQNGGFFDFQGLPLGNIERIEIARGPQSAVWGSAAMTGVVNFVSRTGTPGPPHWGLRLERGAATEKSNNYLGSASLSGGSARLRYAGEVGTTFMRGIHAVPHDVRSREAAVKVDVMPSSALDLGLTLRGTAVDGNLPVRDQGATRVPLDPNAQNQRDRVIGSLVARHRLAQRWQQQLRASNYYEDFNYEDQKDGVQSDEFFIFDESFTFNDRLRRTTGEYVLSFEPSLDARQRVTVGAQVEREALKERTGGAIGDDQVSFDRNSWAGYAELQASLTRGLDVLIGSRVEKYEQIAAEHTPRASLGIGLSPNLRLRAAAARGFKAPNLQQQYANNPYIEANPNLAAETSISYELGGDAALFAGRVALSAAVFHQDFANLIRTVAQENNTKQINRNLGSSEARGIEWELRVGLRNDLRLTSTGALIRTRIEDNEGLDESQYPRGGQLPFRPEYVLGFAAEWQPVSQLTAVLRMRAIGQQFALTERFSGQRVQIDGYTISGFNLNYAHSAFTTVYLRVDNLFDREYAPAFDQRGTPLTVSLGLRIGN